MNQVLIISDKLTKWGALLGAPAVRMIGTVIAAVIGQCLSDTWLRELGSFDCRSLQVLQMLEGLR